MVVWDDPIHREEIRKARDDETKSYMMETRGKLCLFAAFKLNSIDLAWRMPTLDDYMS